jgi:hypothetical protein
VVDLLVSTQEHTPSNPIIHSIFKLGLHIEFKSTVFEGVFWTQTLIGNHTYFGNY